MFRLFGWFFILPVSPHSTTFLNSKVQLRQQAFFKSGTNVAGTTHWANCSIIIKRVVCRQHERFVIIALFCEKSCYSYYYVKCHVRRDVAREC